MPQARARVLPSIEQLHEAFGCDVVTGTLTWRKRPGVVGNAKVAGKPAGSIAVNGYRIVTIRPTWMGVHRVIWAFAHGAWPELHIDHIDGNKLNNRLDNLREATVSQNLSNRGAQKNSRSGLKGVHFDSSANRWRAVIQHQGKSYKLGRFDTAEEASAAYLRASERYHGEFART